MILFCAPKVGNFLGETKRKPKQFLRLFRLCCAYMPMHEVTPKVVAMAVSTVMTIWRIFPQTDLFSIVLFSYEL